MLTSGDIVLITDGSGHTITDQPGRLDLPDIHIGQHGECSLLRWSETPSVILLCGTFQVEEDAIQSLFTLLPRVLHIPGQSDRPQSPFTRLLDVMAEEVEAGRPGTEIVLRRAADMLLIQLIRYWLTTQNGEMRGWLSALRDPQVRQTLSLIHSNPERQWTIEALASEVALSRSTLAARFTTLVGEPPLRYLTRWRMHKAQKLLKSSDLALTDIAHRVGYGSAYAFSKAFKREAGLPPGAYRKENT